jgi:hypothetical protein
VYLIPITLAAADVDEGRLFTERQGRLANVLDAAAAYVQGVGLDVMAEPTSGEHMWMHALAIGYAPRYLAVNADGIHLNWPRIPLPATGDVLLASAKLGSMVAELLDDEKVAVGVTAGTQRRELAFLGRVSMADEGQLNASAGDLGVTAGWGFADRRGVVMSGNGRAVEHPYADAEPQAFSEGLADLGLTCDRLIACLGSSCYHVYLNDVAYWRCVPASVWYYTIGGYRVIKKWLSYRERTVLGSDLLPDEARHVTEMVRRIAAILLLERPSAPTTSG